MGTGNNVPGRFFTLDGNTARFPSAGGTIPGNTVAFSVSTGTFNALQQSDVHAYWEFNRGTNWVFPHYELPFTGGFPGTFPDLQYALQSVIPGSGPFGVVNTAATHGDDPNNPRDPDRFEPVSSGQTETQSLHPQRADRRNLPERFHAAGLVLAGWVSGRAGDPTTPAVLTSTSNLR